MRLLLDTHLLLWALSEPKRLGTDARLVLEDPGNDVLFSAASIWEIAVKAALGRADFAFDPRQILQEALQTGFKALSVNAEAAVQVTKLPPYHRDPFDRILIAQAISEPVRLYTADAVLTRYSELVTLIRS